MVKILEIVDSTFQRALYDAIASGSEDRRFENHATDLLYCLVKAFSRKVLPPELFSKESYSMILKWMSGKGIEIGITNAMKLETQVRVGYNPNDPESSGSIDFFLKDIPILVHVVEAIEIPYELKTTMYSYESRKMPFITQVLQLMQYMAAKGVNVGRVKLWYIKRYRDKETMHYRVEPGERTWEVYMSDADLEQRRSVMSRYDSMLTDSLVTGDWHKLLKSSFDWECRDCYICTMLTELESNGDLKVYHDEYLKSRCDYLVRKAEKDISG